MKPTIPGILSDLVAAEPGRIEFSDAKEEQVSTVDLLQSRLMDPTRRDKFASHRMLSVMETIDCADGLRLSVQASRTHYCQPRDDSGPWHEVEVGFPSSCVEELMPWAENADSPTETVYGYVPIEVVAAVIDAHGGVKK